MALRVELLRTEKVLMGSRTRLQSEAAPWGRSPCSGRSAAALPRAPQGGEGLGGSVPPTDQRKGTGQSTWGGCCASLWSRDDCTM